MTNQPTTNQGQFNPADYNLDRVTKIITASVLGDGSLQLPHAGKNARYQTTKTLGHEDYLGWLRSVIELVVPTKTYTTAEHPHTVNPAYTNKASDRIVSRTHPLLTNLHATYYHNRKKLIPEGIELDLESVAVLLMDDGFRDARDGNIVICTDGFDLDSVEILHEAFTEVTELPWRIIRHGNLKNGDQVYQLRLARRYVAELASMLKPFVFPSYYYKLGLELDGITEIPLKMRSI